MFLINIIAFILITLFIAIRFDTLMVKAVPVTMSIMVLVLYVLAFFRGLWLVDAIGVATLLLACIYIVRNREGRAAVMSAAKEKLLSPTFIIFILFSILMTAAVWDKLATWWDDINYWATDAKAIYYLSGFAGKYANVAPEFGDYPPGLSLVKWWFLHMDGRGFNEGLMFAGYYFLLFTFLAPLLGLLEKKKLPVTILGSVLLIFLPCTVEAFWCDGACADLIMGIIYGQVLISIAGINMPKVLGIKELTAEEKKWQYVKTTLFLSTMMLCKTTSFIWIIMSFIFWALSYALSEKKVKKGFWRPTFTVYVLPIITYVSWYAFCLVNRRVSHLTSNSIKMATGNMNLPGIKTELLKAYGEAFLKWPLHRYYNGIINISPLGFILFCMAVLCALWAFKILEKKYMIFIMCFSVISGLAFYGINLVSHLTVFATEEQYLEAFAMVSSMERYGSPFTMGTIILILTIVLNRPKAMWGALCIAAFILLTTDYESTYRTFISYRDKTSDIISERADIITDENRVLIDEVPLESKKSLGRVLYIRDVNDYSRVRDTYLSFMVSPLPVVYAYADTGSMSMEDMIALANENHAKHIFVNGELKDAIW